MNIGGIRVDLRVKTFYSIPYIIESQHKFLKGGVDGVGK